MYIVYKTTNVINRKFYVGVHNGKNDDYLGSGKLIKSAIEKYGRENFIRETILSCETSEEAYELEALIVDEEFTARKDTYNLCYGGYGYSSEYASIQNRINAINGTNPWGGGKGSKAASQRNKDRVINGTNPWAGEKGSKMSSENMKRRTKEGTNPSAGVQGTLRNKIMIANGTHPSQKEWVCPHCNKHGFGIANGNRWHFDKCKKLKE